VVAIEKDEEERQKKKRKRNPKKQAHQAELTLMMWKGVIMMI